MSENLDLVRSIFAAWERGDFSSVEWADPEIEWVIAAGPTPGRWTGLPKIAEAWRGFLSTWEEARVVVDDYREFDDERVLVFLHYSGRGKTSGLELGQIGSKVACLFHLRGAKVTKLVLYWDRERALADLGLEEYPMSERNVEIMRALFDGWNAGDRPDPAQYCDPAVELESPFSLLNGEPYRGYAGIEQWMRDVDEQFSQWQVEVDDLRAAGDAVVVIGTTHARGRASEIDVDLPLAFVADFGAAGRIARARIFPDVNAALKAAGLAG